MFLLYNLGRPLNSFLSPFFEFRSFIHRKTAKRTCYSHMLCVVLTLETMRLMKLYLYSEIIEGCQKSFYYITFEKIRSKQSYFVSDRTTNKNKMELRGHWLRYSNTPNAPNLFTQSSQAMHLVFIFLMQPLPGNCLCSNSAHRKPSRHTSLTQH